VVPNEITGLGSLAGLGVFTAVEPPIYFGLFNRGTTLYKWDFANDTVSTVASSLPNSNDFMVGHSNVGTAGYAASGAGSSILWGNKTAYSNLTTSSLSNAPLGRNQPSGAAGNTGVAGYVVGGNSSTNAVLVNTSTNKVNYANDTQSTLSNMAADGITSQGGASASNVGQAALTQRTNSSSSRIKMPYSTETYGFISGFSQTFNSNSAVTSNSGTAGYFYPGYLSSANASVWKWGYSADTQSVLSSTATPARYWATGIYRTGVAGYFIGGNDGAGSTNKMPFSTETFSVSTAVNAAVGSGDPRGASVSNGG